MESNRLHDFLALLDGRSDIDVARVLAAVQAAAHELDQQKETDMDPEEYRRELLDMGAEPGDADAAVEDLQRWQGGQ